VIDLCLLLSLLLVLAILGFALVLSLLVLGGGLLGAAGLI
jgi:hypothetical protein